MFQPRLAIDRFGVPHSLRMLSPFHSHMPLILFHIAPRAWLPHPLKHVACSLETPLVLLVSPTFACLLVSPTLACLLAGTWNFPLQLELAPLVGALAAGNTALIKPVRRP